MALIATAAQLERLCRGYRMVSEGEAAPRREERSVNKRLLPGGMVRLEMVMEPDEADLILRAVDRAREVNAERVEPDVPAQPESAASAEIVDVSAEARWPSRADGAVEIAESFLAGNPVTGTGGERFQVTVHLERDDLGSDDAWKGTLEDGTRVSAETLRRVACDCGLVAVRHDGEALDIGRRTRGIPPAIRRALMMRDRGCAFPGCTHARFLHAHHHLVHEGGWTVTAAGDPRRERVADAPAWLREWAEENDLYLGPEVNMPQWDGKSPDYTQAVCSLVDADFTARSRSASSPSAWPARTRPLHLTPPFSTPRT
jgi:hypothetical protein